MKYYKIRRYDTDVHVVEFSPDKFVSQISFGKKGVYEPLSEIKHTWYEARGYYPLVKTNLGFFGQGIEQYGLVIWDGGHYQGSPTSAEKQVECYLDKNNEFHVGKMTEQELDQIKQKNSISWGGSLSYSLVINGEKNTISSNLYTHFNERHPRTFIGQRKDKTMLICTADGRSSWDKGLTGDMEAEIMLELGAYNAINADGGGSSEMICRGKDGMKVVNSPSDGHEREIGTALIILGKEPIDLLNDSTIVKQPPPKQEIDITLGISIGHGSDTWDVKHAKGVVDENGNVFEEHDFNSECGIYAKELAEYNGFKTFLPQPPHSPDVGLQHKINEFNKKKVDLTLGIHANASSSDKARGHSAFYWYNSDEGKRLAIIWDKWADKILPTLDRNITPCEPPSVNPNTWTNFGLVRETNMITMLNEYAFFTNKIDRDLLKSDLFARQGAEVLIRSACEFYNKDFKLLPGYYDNGISNPPIQDNNQNNTTPTIDYLVQNNILRNIEGLVNKLDQPIPYGENLELIKRVVELIKKS